MTSPVDFHIHSTGSDGKMEPEEVIEREIRLGTKYICFTDHLPFPQDAFKIGKNFHNQKYTQEIERLQKKYKAQIDISLGAECDYFEGREDWTKNLLKEKNYDYLLGSVHFLKINGEFFGIDSNKENWIKCARILGGKEKLIQKYYIQLRAMISSKLFDSVGHFDLVKIYNKDFSLFSEDSDFYKNEVLETLDLVKKNNMCIEINTSGWRKNVQVQYPSIWILKEARKRNIPITIGSDAHRIEDVGKDLDKAIEIAKKIGYSSVSRFKKRKRIEVKI